MKKTLLLLALLSSMFLIAQTKLTAKKMPIYFGCEKELDNKSLVGCMNTNLSHDIQNQIAYFSNIADYLQVQEAKSKLRFRINKEGKFDKLSAEGSNPIFNSVAISSLILLQNKMILLKFLYSQQKMKKKNR